MANPPKEDPAVVKALVENHRRFAAFLQRRVGSPEDAEDILQAAFLKSVEKGDSIQKNESAVAWFYRLLRNAITDHHRRCAAEGRALGKAEGLLSEAGELDASIEKAVCRCVLDLLPTLPEHYAALLRRVDLEDASIAEIASAQGARPNNVRVKLHRARKALRKRVELSCGSCAEHGCLDCTCKRLPNDSP